MSDAIELFGLRAFYASEFAQNNLFGQKIFSSYAVRRAFIISGLFSFGLILILYCSQQFIVAEPVFIANFFVLFVGYILFAIPNAAFDYLSISQTRLIFRFSKNRGIFIILILSVIDYMLSCYLSPIMAAFILALIGNLFTSTINLDNLSYIDLLKLLQWPLLAPVTYLDIIGVDVNITNIRDNYPGISFQGYDIIIICCTVSSLFLSIWNWLHLLGSAVMMILFSSSRILRYSFVFAERHDWYLMAPVVLGLAFICLVGLPFVVYYSS